MIVIKNVEKKYNNNIIFSQDSDINIKEGLNYLIGGNGSGKTSFLKVLIGISKLQWGCVEYDNQCIEKHLHEIGVMFDREFFYSYLSGIDNLLYFNSILDKPNKVEKVIQIANEWGIDNTKLPVKSYSLGMKKKLNIVLSLLKDPKYWYLDEPFNGLDIDTQRLLLNKIQLMKKENKVIILVSHDIESNIKLADHIITIDKLKIKYYPDILNSIDNLFTDSISIDINEIIPCTISSLILHRYSINNTTEIMVNSKDKQVVINELIRNQINIIDMKPKMYSLKSFIKRLEVM